MRFEQTWIAVGDGSRLAADLNLPDTPDHAPALLEALPYRKDDLTAESHADDYRRLCAEGGFVVCRLDLRGTGSSPGRATDEYPPSELDDLADVTAWLAAQPNAEEYWVNIELDAFEGVPGEPGPGRSVVPRPPQAWALVAHRHWSRHFPASSPDDGGGITPQLAHFAPKQ